MLGCVVLRIRQNQFCEDTNNFLLDEIYWAPHGDTHPGRRLGATSPIYQLMPRRGGGFWHAFAQGYTPAPDQSLPSPRWLVTCAPWAMRVNGNMTTTMGISGSQKSQLRQFSGEENIQHFDGVRGNRRKPSHLQLHYGAQGGIRDLGQPRQPKGAWWKAPGLVCGCRVAVRTGGRGPDLAAHLQSQAYRKLRCLLRVPV